MAESFFSVGSILDLGIYGLDSGMLLYPGGRYRDRDMLFCFPQVSMTTTTEDDNNGDHKDRRRRRPTTTTKDEGLRRRTDDEEERTMKQ